MTQRNESLSLQEIVKAELFRADPAGGGVLAPRAGADGRAGYRLWRGDRAGPALCRAVA